MTTHAVGASQSNGHASPIKLPQLPIAELGFPHVPAVPVDLAGMVDTLFRLG